MLLTTRNDVKEDDVNHVVFPEEEAQTPLTSPALWLRCRVRCCRWTSALVGLLLCKGSRGSMNVVVRELWSTKKACRRRGKTEFITNAFFFKLCLRWTPIGDVGFIRPGGAVGNLLLCISLLQKDNTFPSH